MLIQTCAPDWSSVSQLQRELHLWGFRGQADASWPLESTLARLASQYHFPSKWLNHREYTMLRSFERRAFDNLDGVPAPTTKLDWLSLLQHHGAPTRLIDFSHSFYVAAFFAMETALEDAAVWAINLEKLRCSIASQTGGSVYSENLDHTNVRHLEFIEPFLGVESPASDNPNLVLSVEPERLHGRLSIQQGFFLCPTDLMSTFESSLGRTLEPQAPDPGGFQEISWGEFSENYLEIEAVKILLPRGFHRDALGDLLSMNISSATLFPGLDGFARSMRYHVRALGK